MLGGTPGLSDTQQISNGLAANHAYTILSLHDLKNEDGSLKA